MMMGGPGRMLNTETQKPKNVGATLVRFWSYFRPWWYAIAATLLLIVVATAMQVATAPIVGQAVDCYLLPNPAACWYTTADPAAGFDARMAGLTGLVGLLLLFFIGGSMLQGLAFYTMNWAGQRALRRIREDTFEQIHRLSLGFYARNEAGNIMSRITSDTDTIQQVLCFALLSVDRTSTRLNSSH